MKNIYSFKDSATTCFGHKYYCCLFITLVVCVVDSSFSFSRTFSPIEHGIGDTPVDDKAYTPIIALNAAALVVPPVLSATEGTILAYLEDQGPVQITASIVVNDVDNTDITSAIIRVSNNYINGQDVLAFTNMLGISGAFNSATGTLTLSGAAPLADYQTALRSITYQNTNTSSPNPATRTVSFTVNDGALNSNTEIRYISVTPVNDLPVLAAIEAANLVYNEGQAATVITTTITITDVDHVNLTGASIQISDNYINTEDILSFTPASGITGSFDENTGILTLSGTSSVLNYRNALRAVRYQNTNGDNPSPLARTISFKVTDGVDESNIGTRSITVIPVNDLPLLSAIEATSLVYTEEQLPTEITSTLTITDVDNTTMSSATVQITSNYSSTQDVLAFTSMFGITASYNTTSGLLSLSGVATIADYETALRSVTYQNTNTGNPSTATRTVTFRVNDGTGNSNLRTRTISIIPVNDAPVLTGIESTPLAYSEGQAAAIITSNINVTDVDNANLTGATIQITGNYASGEDILTFVNTAAITGVFDAATGTLNLSGTTSLTNYRNALRGVRFLNTNNDNPSALLRTVSYTVTDGTDLSEVVTRDIIFTAINDVPVLADIEDVTLPYTEDDGPVIVTSTITIQDVDNTTLASAVIQIAVNYNSTQDVLAFTNANGISGTFNPANGTLTLSGVASLAAYELALRSVTYENVNLINPSTAVRTVRFTVNDGAGISIARVRTITISVVNDPPVLAFIENAALVYTEDQAATSVTTSTTVVDGDNTNLTGATIQITANYINTEDILSFTNASGITGVFDVTTGTMTLTGNSSVVNYQNAIRNIRYRNSNNATPSPFTRTVSFTVRDAEFNSNTLTRDIIIVPVNDPPTAVNETVDAVEETDLVINVLANDFDVDNAIDPTTVVIISGPANGTLSVNPLTGEVTYSPNINFSGINTFRYTVNDVSNATSNIATVTINVANINDVPYFTGGANQVVTEDAGTQTIVDWATNIDDGDPFTTQTLTFVLTNNNNSLFAAQPSVNAAGTLTFRSANNASGTATVTIYLRDNGSSTPPNVNQSDTQTFTITVLSVNDPPNAVADFFSTSSDTPLTASMRANDSDVENNVLTVTTTPVSGPSFGTVVINSIGTFTYTPNGSYTGVDTFRYQICDDGTDNGVPAPRCSEAEVTITVNPPNDEYNIVGNNSIQISKHCFILTKALNNQQGAVWNRKPLDLRYSFELNFDAIFSDSGVVKDAGADGIIFMLQRDYTPPPLNTPGSPINARGLVGEYLGVGGISPSIGIEVDTYQNAGEPAYDHIAISRDGSVYNIIAPPVPAKVDGTNTPVNIEDGVSHTVTITWDKPTNTLFVYFDGEQRTSYTGDIINDIFEGDPTNIYWGFSASTGGSNNYQGVCGLNMFPVNLPPIAGNDTGTLDEDTAYNGSVLANDADPEGGVLTVTPATIATAHGNVVMRQDGTYTYTPLANYNGLDSFTYEVCDDFNAEQCSVGTVNLTILPTPDDPVALADVYTLSEDTPLNVPSASGVLANDFDVDGESLTAVLDATTTQGTLTLNTDGSFMYLPFLNFFGTDSFTYHASDGLANSAVVTVTLTILPVNDAPIAVNDVVETEEDTQLVISVLLNDIDVDNPVSTSVITIASNALHGSLSLIGGAITYLPTLDYNGADSFTYFITDAGGAVSNIATVTITVHPVNDAPVAVNDNAITAEDVPVIITMLTNDTDVDNAIDAASVIIGTFPVHGQINLNTVTGVVTYTPAPNYFGADTFTYSVKDVSGLTSNFATVNITITSVNDPPVANNDEVTTRQLPIAISVLSNDTDIDNALNSGSVVIISNPVNGMVTLNTTTGVVTYVPDQDYLGGDSFTYTVEDVAGLTSNVATVSILVTPANRPPVAVNDGPITFSLFQPIIIDVLGNDFDPDNDIAELTIIAVSNPQAGSVIIEGNVIRFVPSGLTESTTLTFSYTIQDLDGLTSDATVTLQYVYQPLTASEGFSPNSDHNNDTWYIRAIENFPNNTIHVFNRWGILVYTAKNYDNHTVLWDGRANTGMQSGSVVDHGTYYYTLDLGNNSKVQSGYVVIVR